LPNLRQIIESLLSVVPPIRRLYADNAALSAENAGLWRSLKEAIGQGGNAIDGRSYADIATGQPGPGVPLSAIPPFYILHYKRNAERRRYLEAEFSQYALPKPELITDFDAGEFSLGDFYTYDETQYRRTVGPISHTMIVPYHIGRVLLPDASWVQCFEIYKNLNLDLDQEFNRHPFMKPHPLRSADVSLILKHRSAWEKIANGGSEHVIIAEDDVIFFPHSVEYLSWLTAHLPADFDYIDLAGGSYLLPRAGDRQVNDVFFEMIPPRCRTTCCALLSRSFVRRLLALETPICAPIDWIMNHDFHVLQAKVYWVHPLVFGHGSVMKVYQSNLRPEAS